MKLEFVLFTFIITYVSCHGFEDGCDDTRPGQNEIFKPSRVWSFTMPINAPPFSQLDENTMESVGITLDMMRAVCKIANKHCVFSFNDDFARCWSDVTQSSEGLDNGWFDACPMYHKTTQRALMYAFSRPYTKEPQLSLLVRNSENILIEDLMRDNDISIGFVRNSFTTPECLERNGLIVNKDLARFYKDFSEAELFDKLDKGEVRVLFKHLENPDPNRFKKLNLEGMNLTCAVTGLSVMTRKNNVELLEWVNPAIDVLVQSEDYKWMCYVWSKIFNQTINCY